MPVKYVFLIPILCSHQGQLTLMDDTDYDCLQSLIEALFNIPADQQKIRYGFPPKELARCCPLPIKNGDKLLVDVLTVKEMKFVRVPSPLPIEQIHMFPQSEIADWIGK